MGVTAQEENSTQSLLELHPINPSSNLNQQQQTPAQRGSNPAELLLNLSHLTGSTATVRFPFSYFSPPFFFLSFFF